MHRYPSLGVAMKRTCYLFALIICFATPAFGQSNIITISSKFSAIETMDRFEAAARAEKFQIFARVDFQALTAANGGKIPPNQILIFGRGGILPPILPTTPLAAIDLPLKALAWEDANGKVWLAFNTGEYLKERHNLVGKEELLKRVTDALQGLAKRAIE